MIGWLSALLDALIPSRVAVRNVVEAYSKVIAQKDARILSLEGVVRSLQQAVDEPAKSVERPRVASRLQREIAAMDPKARALIDWNRLGLEEPSVRS